MSELEVDLYFSFRSPWSYYGACQMFDLQQAYALRVNLLVVNPINVDLPADDPGHLVHKLSPLGWAA